MLVHDAQRIDDSIVGWTRNLVAYDDIPLTVTSPEPQNSLSSRVWALGILLATSPVVFHVVINALQSFARCMIGLLMFPNCLCFSALTCLVCLGMIGGIEVGRQVSKCNWLSVYRLHYR